MPRYGTKMPCRKLARPGHEQRTITHSTAFAMSASSNTMIADLPPSSIVVGRRLAAAAMLTRRPVATEPVKATFATAGCPLPIQQTAEISLGSMQSFKSRSSFAGPCSRAPEGRSRVCAVTADHVEDAGGQADLVRDGRHLQASDAAHLRGLQHRRVAGCQGRRHLPLHAACNVSSVDARN